MVELDNPCQPHKGHSIREWFGGSYREFTLAAGTTYDYQLAAFVDAVENGSPLPTGGEDAIDNMSALDEIYVRPGFAHPSPADPDFCLPCRTVRTVAVLQVNKSCAAKIPTTKVDGAASLALAHPGRRSILPFERHLP